MDPMVSSRVPAALRTRVNARLKELGSSPTELINLAYEFVDITGSLPRANPSPQPGIRRLTGKQKNALADALARETCAVPEEFFDGRDYDDLLEDELRRSYEALL